MKESRNHGDTFAAFGLLVNALDRGRGSDGDTNAAFPRSDAEDLAAGARHIPQEVTVARRAGQKVTFVTKGRPEGWYWIFPDGSRRYHNDLTRRAPPGVARSVRGIHG